MSMWLPHLKNLKLWPQDLELSVIKKRVAEFSQMMADKARERELEEQFEKNT